MNDFEIGAQAAHRELAIQAYQTERDELRTRRENAAEALDGLVETEREFGGLGREIDIVCEAISQIDGRIWVLTSRLGNLKG